jgi:hypothetical protein
VNVSSVANPVNQAICSWGTIGSLSKPKFGDEIEQEETEGTEFETLTTIKRRVAV